jgi:hypothetical protein
MNKKVKHKYDVISRLFQNNSAQFPPERRSMSHVRRPRGCRLRGRKVENSFNQNFLHFSSLFLISSGFGYYEHTERVEFSMGGGG